MNYRILMPTCDKYISAVKPFAFLLKKYWPNHPDVVVGGFSTPEFDMPDGFSFISLGPQEMFPIERWSDQIYNFLSSVPDEVFVFMLEDMWIIEPVKADIVQMAFDYMVQFEYVARFDLTGDRLHAGDARFYGKLGSVDLIWSNPDGQYHLSTMPGLWRKKHLLKVLIPNETPWQLELEGTPRLGNLKESLIVLGTNAWPVRNTLAFRGGDVNKLLLDEVDPVAVEEMSDLGLLKDWE
jgi:hypothetical protein